MNTFNKHPNLLSKINFKETKPYKFCYFGDFLNIEFANKILNDFPNPKDNNYKNYCIEDGGNIGKNYANSDKNSWSKYFIELDNILQSKEFIDHLQSITGIKDLIYDKDYQGGGIRVSEDNTFLPIYLDFNRHPRLPLHRRLNLLLYFNKDWQEKYGGSIQVHKNPYDNPNGNSFVKEFPPLFNTAFIFETSENSWHGFSRLELPKDKRRLLFSIYYYTKDRPEGDVPFRNTEYVESWIPKNINLGENLSIVSELLQRRDDRIKMLYKLRREFDGKYHHLL